MQLIEVDAVLVRVCDRACTTNIALDAHRPGP